MDFELQNSSIVIPPNKVFFIKDKLPIRKGQIISLWGANGIGKSTLIRKIYSEFSTKNFDVIKPNIDIDYKMGVIPQNVNELLFPWLKVDKVIDLFESNFVSINGKVNIKDVTNSSKKIKNLSGGEKQLLALELLLSFKFDILFLDEPFSAMDFDNINIYASKLKTYAKETNTTVFIVLHDLKALQKVSDYILLFSSKRKNISCLKNDFKEQESINYELLNMLYE